MSKRKLCVLALALVVTLASTGCIGRYGLTKEVREWNMEVADSNWGRESVFFLLIPVYILSGYVDLLVFNSWEFWSGTNPISGEPALADVPPGSTD